MSSLKRKSSTPFFSIMTGVNGGHFLEYFDSFCMKDPLALNFRTSCSKSKCEVFFFMVFHFLAFVASCP